jgi:nucleoid-associated protein YgaU
MLVEERSNRMIFKGSRYEKVGVYQLTGPDGQTVNALNIRFIPPTPAGYLHTFSADQRLDILAYNFYRNPEKFWLIADANTEMDPEDLLEPGRKLRIPPDRT